MAIETSRGSAVPYSPVEDEIQPVEDEVQETDSELDGLDLEPPRDVLPEGEYETRKERLVAWIDDNNIARHLDIQTLDKIGQLVVAEYTIDKNSRNEWEQEAREALKFATQESEQKQYPWPNACFSLDTDLLTRRGWVPVADVVLGDEVLSRAPGGVADFYPVVATYRGRAPEMVHFQGKSIDLLVTPNHRMVVEDNSDGGSSFIEAADFVSSSRRQPCRQRLAGKSIPLTSFTEGSTPDAVYGIPTIPYMRLLGWFISEGSALYGRNMHINKAGETIDYGVSGSSFSLAQSKRANPEKYEELRRDIEACGFSYKAYENGFVVHARLMPELLKAELRSLGRAHQKHIPRHVFSYGAKALTALLDTLLAGDGHVRARKGRQQSASYFTVSRALADDVQELCQRIGVRGTITTRAATLGGVVNGRQIVGAQQGYTVSINLKQSIQVAKLRRTLITGVYEVACVEVAPHHTVYARRNGKAVWSGNSNIIFPLITTAAFQFSAMTYPAIVDHRNVAKGEVWGSDDGTPETKNGKPDGAPVLDDQGQVQWIIPPGDKQRRAGLVGEHMSWQLLEEMREWEAQTDTGFMQMPIVGGFVRKTFHDPSTKENRSLLVNLLDIVWNKSAPSFERAPRHTEILEYYPHEIEELERADETFLHYLYGPGNSADQGGDGEETPIDANDTLAPLRFLEQHRRYDLDGDGYAEPLIVTVHQQSGHVVRIVARYEEPDISEDDDGDIIRIKATEYYTLYPFLPNPKGGSIPVGFGHLLKPMNEAINTTINQMFDAGHLQIAGGGFMGTSLSIHSGPVNFSLGEYKPVNNKGQSIRDAIFPIPWPGPSPVLFQLLGFLVNAAKDVASIQNILSGDASMANMQPTTLLALIEQGMWLYKRIFRSLKSELRKLYALNYRYIGNGEHFKRGDTWMMVSKEDYRLSGGVCPAADPNMVTDMQKITRAMILANYQNDPLCNPLEIRRRLFEAARIEHIDKILVTTPPSPPPDKQLEIANLQADLGRKRAAEQKDATQAILNLALARKNVQESEIAPLEALTEQIRVHLEAVNATIKAADVDAKFHGHNIKLKQAQESAADAGKQLKNATQNGSAATKPTAGGPVGGELPAMAPPSGDQILPGLSGASGGQLPAGPPAGMGVQSGA